MGLLILLMGFLGLSAAGLLTLAPPAAAATEQALPGEEGPGQPGESAGAPAAAHAAASPAEAEAISLGDALFKNNCAQCHAVNEKVVGPALGGITKRRTIGWLIPWVKNSSKVIASGDDYAVKLFNDNGKQQMPAFPQLSDKEIKGIIAWINSQDTSQGG